MHNTNLKLKIFMRIKVRIIFFRIFRVIKQSITLLLPSNYKNSKKIIILALILKKVHSLGYLLFPKVWY